MNANKINYSIEIRRGNIGVNQKSKIIFRQHGHRQKHAKLAPKGQ